jgi:hypothetical protein
MCECLLRGVSVHVGICQFMRKYVWVSADESKQVSAEWASAQGCYTHAMNSRGKRTRKWQMTWKQ